MIIHAPSPAAFLEWKAFCNNYTSPPLLEGCLSIIGVSQTHSRCQTTDQTTGILTLSLQVFLVLGP